MEKVKVNFEVCKGCGLCVMACPKKLMKIGSKSNDKGYFVVECVDQDACVSCASCARMCPDSALEVSK
jgi:2-oxoglutarate ferredoxin oxidoreductase subunit delta